MAVMRKVVDAARELISLLDITYQLSVRWGAGTGRPPGKSVSLDY